jgi:Uma2 family endonuclease
MTRLVLDGKGSLAMIRLLCKGSQMRTPAFRYRPSIEEYLQQEVGSRVRREYVAGEIFAMAGGTPQHNAISLNIAAALVTHLGEGPSQPYMSDVKLRFKINSDEYVYYPDVFVDCEGPVENCFRSPRLIVEVLSPSTEYIDRHEKVVNYLSIPTLQEFVMVAQDPYEVTLQRRSDDWRSIVFTQPEEVVEFRSVELSLSVAAIYRRVAIPVHPGSQQ